jgi:hypothetical protein
MIASELTVQFNTLAGTLAITAVVWALCCLSAVAGYRTFHQRLDLGWAAAFLALAVVHAVDAYAAWRTAQEFGDLAMGPVGVLEFTSYYRIRVAGLAMLAAFGILLLFRRRHELTRRSPVDAH